MGGQCLTVSFWTRKTCGNESPTENKQLPNCELCTEKYRYCFCWTKAGWGDLIMNPWLITKTQGQKFEFSDWRSNKCHMTKSMALDQRKKVYMWAIVCKLIHYFGIYGQKAHISPKIWIFCMKVKKGCMT